ncbi:MarR family transcriptional regulator [Ostreiculturibacter nitratireducens]|uniref:MarR family winged helix-turn-helix transcriptional regulator n=1 Tax=Ostreiculturibacter nitratireducens TaxID=3075226 RepID=UPI0031B56568
MSQNLELFAFLKAVRRLSRALDMHSSRINRESGLTLPQLIVLTCIRDLGQVTSRAISIAADLSAPTVVGILDNLEAKGLIERYRSETDRRIVHTRLTDRGRHLLEEAPSPMGDAFEARFMALGEDQRRALLSALMTTAEMVGSDEAANARNGQTVSQGVAGPS